MTNPETAKIQQDEIAVLISRVALGDRAAFNSLYVKSSAKLFGVCLRILNNRAEAEDALQEIYVKIWHRADRFALHKLGEDGSSIAWLASIARNHAIDVLRKRKPPARNLDDVFDLADKGPDPEDNSLSLSLGRQIESCLAELETERAKAIKGAYLDGYSYQELADQFGIPLNTMRTWLRRGLKNLRECLEGQD